MPRIAKPVVIVDETLMLSNGKSPVRISQMASKIIPRFLPAKLSVIAMRSSFWIYRLGIVKYFRNVRVQQYYVRALRVIFVKLSANSSAEVVLVSHLGFVTS